MKWRLSITLLLSCLGMQALAATLTDTHVRVEPIQPLEGEDFVIVVEGMTEAGPVTVEEVLRVDQDLEIRLHHPTCPGFTCVPQSFRVEIPIDGSSTPFISDVVNLWVNARAGIDDQRTTLFYTHFAVGDIFYHSMDPRVVLNPWTPSDNDHLQLLVPVQANVCGPGTPWLDRIERSGSRLSVFLRFSPGFGGELIGSGESVPKCSPAIPYLSVTPVDLGVLAAGNYTLDLYFQSSREHALPLRVAVWDFPVSDAPDAVDLRDGRFKVEVEWRDSEGNTGVGKPVPGPTSDSTLFTFFGPNNWETLIKVLDGCAINDRFWVFGAAATDAEYTITVTDIQSGDVWTYTNPLGTASAAINDTEAFASCP